MYDLAELRCAHEQLWAAIAARLRAAGVPAPEQLSAPDNLDAHWRDPRLLLSQSCGYPLLRLPGSVQVVATPCYRAEGCEGPSYRSALVVRAEDTATVLADLRGRVCAINGLDSNSGMNLLRAAIAPLARAGRFFGRVEVCGSHLRSMDLVASGAADLAAIDCVTWALARQHRPGLTSRLRVLGWTASAPALPLVSQAGAGIVVLLRDALAQIAHDPSMRPVLDTLLIERFDTLPRARYAIIDTLEHAAIAAGYPDIA